MSSEHSALSLGIPIHDHLAAQALALAYPAPAKRQQVYLNTLAVRVVKHYLQGLGIAADDWDEVPESSLRHGLHDYADLNIPGWGILACRPVCATETHCYLPPGPKTGYVAVQFDADVRYGTLVGFLPHRNGEMLHVSLNAFQDFQVLLSQIPVAPAVTARTRLEDWLTGNIHAGWHSLELLLNPGELALAPVRQDASGVMEQGKLLILDSGDEPLVLIIGCEPIAREGISAEIAIGVELWAMNEAQLLPDDLELQLLEGGGKTLMQVQARASSRLKFTFTGELGDEFDVKVMHNESIVIESFTV